MLALTLRHWVITWLLLTQSLVCSKGKQWMWFTALHSAPPELTGASGWWGCRLRSSGSQMLTEIWHWLSTSQPGGSWQYSKKTPSASSQSQENETKCTPVTRKRFITKKAYLLGKSFQTFRLSWVDRCCTIVILYYFLKFCINIMSPKKNVISKTFVLFCFIIKTGSKM